ncbi:hypothetical protein [Oceanibium sediminis]|uniref:hypothetical protein n=1 Tax=Oceanibium sediminis TaxID=2026339 RepID=UPI000DD3E5D5|nr:hypothetical protein [Oceanibium sediminis]
MARRAAYVLGFGAALTLLACAPALTAADCAGAGLAPVDAKAGVIARDSHLAGTGRREIRRDFIDCASGAGIRTTIEASDGRETTVNLISEVNALTASVPEGPRLAQLQEGLGLMGIAFSRTSYGAETCGCAVFYPELRGAKPGFKAST